MRDPLAIMGVRVILSDALTEDDHEHVAASYRRPLWRRLASGATCDPVPVTVQIPSRQALQLPNGSLVFHPATWNEVRAHVP